MVAAGLIGLGGTAAPAAPAAPTASPTLQPNVDHRWLVVLCHWTDMRDAEPLTASDLTDMWTSAGADRGNYNLVDYWRDVTYGQFTMSADIANGAHADSHGWYTVPKTHDEWAYAPTWAPDKPWDFTGRDQKVTDCANQASQDYNLHDYWGVVTYYPLGQGHLVDDISADSKTMKLDRTPENPAPGPFTNNYFPPLPFLMNINDGTTTKDQDGNTVSNNEVVKVLSINHVTGVYKIERGQRGTTPKMHKAGKNYYVISPNDFGAGGVGRQSVTLPGVNGRGAGTYDLALVTTPTRADLTGLAHELGHGMGYDHSRALSSSTSDYRNYGDIMSAYTVDSVEDGPDGLGTPYGGGGAFDNRAGSKGPGLNAANLDLMNLIPPELSSVYDPATRGQDVFRLRSLSDPQAVDGPNDMEIRIPFHRNIPVKNGDTTATSVSSYYTLEYREKRNWDKGLRMNAVLLHLVAPDPLHGNKDYSYRVDTGSPTTTHYTNTQWAGYYEPGATYRDDHLNLLVNEVDPSTTDSSGVVHGTDTALVTLSPTPIQGYLQYTGYTSGGTGERVVARAKLTARADHVGVIPGQTLLFTIAGRTCSAETNLAGEAGCLITLPKTPEESQASVEWIPSNPVFYGASTSAAFSVLPPFTVSPKSLSFGHVVVGAETSYKTLRVKNTSSVPERIGYRFQGFADTDVSEGLGSCTGVYVVQPKKTCTIRLALTPHDGGTTTGTIETFLVTPEGYEWPGTVTATPVTVVGTAPKYTMSPSSVSFGRVTVDYSSLKVITVKNTSKVDVLLRLRNSPPGPSVSLINGTSRCDVGVPRPLSPGTSCMFYVLASPTAPGAISASVSVDLIDAAGHAIDKSGKTTKITGTAVNPTFKLTPASAAFGYVRQGTSKSIVVTVTNQSPSPVAFDYYLNADPAYSIAGTGTKPCTPDVAVPKDGKCQYAITFTPTYTGDAPGQLIVWPSGMPNLAKYLNITGTGFMSD